MNCHKCGSVYTQAELYAQQCTCGASMEVLDPVIDTLRAENARLTRELEKSEQERGKNVDCLIGAAKKLNASDGGMKLAMTIMTQLEKERDAARAELSGL